MRTIKKIKVTTEEVEFIPSELKQDIIYVSKEYETATHLCLCGCGNLSVTPINKGGWNLTILENKLTMKPSILNNNCPNKYHYIITNGIANVC